VSTESAAPKPSLVERLQGQRERHRRRPKPIRAMYVLAGFTVLAFGIITLVTPGPAFVIIPIGLAMLSLEFSWAEQLLGKAIEKGEQAKAKAAQTTRTQRVLTAIAVFCGCLAVLTWGMLGDIPVAPI
jgi:uncharacterized protein (TIGR02611 family)